MGLGHEYSVMYYYCNKYWAQFLYTIDHSQPQHWVMVLAAVILVGYVCLKSITGRSNY